MTKIAERKLISNFRSLKVESVLRETTTYADTEELVLRDVRISFVMHGATLQRNAVWELSSKERKDFQRAGQPYDGWIFVKVEGFTVVLAYSYEDEEGYVVDMFPYSVKRVREQFHANRSGRQS